MPESSKPRKPVKQMTLADLLVESKRLREVSKEIERRSLALARRVEQDGRKR